jgi:hypothetical protein
MKRIKLNAASEFNDTTKIDPKGLVCIPENGFGSTNTLPPVTRAKAISTSPIRLIEAG